MSNVSELRKKAETILNMIVDATNALSPEEAGEVDAVAATAADALYLDIVAAGVKALGDVLAERSKS